MNKAAIEIYQSSENQPELEVRFEWETLWLIRRQMTELFVKFTDTIGLHLKNIFKEGILHEDATTEEYSVVQMEANKI